MSRRLLLVCVALLGLACKRRERPAPEGPPQRIVSQTILSDEVLWALGESVRPRVVGISRLADDPRYSLVAGTWPEDVERMPLSSESLLAKDPDLVIIADFTAVETKTMLEGAGLPTLQLSGFDGFADYRAHLRAIGGAIGAPDEAEALREEFDRALGRPPTLASGLAAVSWNEGNVAGRATTFDDVARAAGLANLAADRGIDGHKPVTLEQLVAWDPAVLVIPCVGDEAQDCRRTERDTAAQPGIAATAAAREGLVVAVPSRYLYSVGRGMLETVAILRRRTARRETP